MEDDISQNFLTFRDAFNLLCGEKIGEGIHRAVYECRLRNDLVVKVESDHSHWRSFSNVVESKFYANNRDHKPVAKWLAPTRFLSPDARILLQDRCKPLNKSDLPKSLPKFLTDVKMENFGKLNGQIVCLDYAITIANPDVRLRTVHWYTGETS